MSAPQLAVHVRLVEGSTSLATSRTHSVVVDRPIDKGGSDLGFLGGELFLAAEGGCYLSNLVAAARARDVVLHRVDIHVRGVQAEQPARFAEVFLDVQVEADAGDDEIARLLTIAERGCIVSNTIKAATPLTLRRMQPAAAMA